MTPDRPEQQAQERRNVFEPDLARSGRIEQAADFRVEGLEQRGDDRFLVGEVIVLVAGADPQVVVYF